MSHHVAVVPARQGSKGLPGKNRMMFARTIEFIKSCGFFAEIIVSTDDEVLLARCPAAGCIGHRRPDALASDHSPISDTFIDLCAKHDFTEDTVLWLFYIPFLRREVADYENARQIIESNPEVRSLSTFVPARSHPYDTWQYDPERGTIKKFIHLDYYNRQDYPQAWENHHYVFAIRPSEVHLVNHNLLNWRTHPVFLDREKAATLLEADVWEDLLGWEADAPEEFRQWYSGLEADEQAAIREQLPALSDKLA